ncbi:MAG: phosphate signaling complex protein PhoU [candidate division Zixibacteria bacterium]|nr:phosphate signaling complex protein PhoU [candidate division Zixibacteria bacterium]
MTKHFQNEIERLKKKILRLTAMVEDALQKAVRAATERNVELAAEVIDTDKAIDAFEIEVEEDCLKILALHQPVAADLRYVVATLKINNDLERIADLAVNIAERAKELAFWPNESAPFDLTSMLDATMMMVRQSVDALVRQDVGIAHKVIHDDDLVDDFHRMAFRSVQKQIVTRPGSVEYYVSLLSVSRNLERIADHATNIAEDVIYMIEGEIIRHSIVSPTEPS